VFRLAVLVLVVLLVVGFQSTDWGRAFGSASKGARLERVQSSKHYRDGVFENPVPTTLGTSYWTMTRRWLFEGGRRIPDRPLSFPFVNPATFSHSPATGLRLTWLGHSTVLIEIDGQRVLTDPVLSERASPSTLVGPRRFFEAPLGVADIPTLDAIVISHDHYDHLDHRTLLALDQKTQRYFVPLGVAAHLIGWGIDEGKIEEMDWWQGADHAGLHFVCTPARHFSGRSLTDTNRTLWASWTLIGPQHRAFFSGDTGYFPQLAEVGSRLGPFDVTLIEAGAYDQLWADIHLGPENAIRAHHDLRGNVMVPVHWGTFNLALHDWDEPIVRLRKLAKEQGVVLAQPRPGQSFEIEGRLPVETWWRD
jgi:L-ascorbate metabolism protein UlaG (beta-lactamase superfamily)